MNGFKHKKRKEVECGEGATHKMINFHKAFSNNQQVRLQDRVILVFLFSYKIYTYKKTEGVHIKY